MAKLKTDDDWILGNLSAKRCEFCESLNLKKYIENNIESWKKPKLYHEHTVAMVDKTWTKITGKRGGSRVTDYKKNGIGYKLNFCPECGKDLKKHKNSHAEDIRELMTKEEITAEDLQAVIDKWKEEAAGHE